MAVPFIKNSFVSGEMSPELYGRTDLEKYGSAASTMRNMYVNYRGGGNSRAGTAFVGYSKQGSSFLPPRLIPFQFSVSQGLVLEFGNYYMRVISNGAMVTQSAQNITGISNSNPAVVSASASGAQTATANNSLVAGSYAPGDSITLDGGLVSIPATLQVVNTTLLAVSVNNPGLGYVPADTVNLAGGTQSSPAIATVATTQLGAIPTIVNAGTGGTPGDGVLTGTTGTGTKFQLNVTITGSQSAAPINGAVTGSYAPGDTVTLAGGTFTAPAVLGVTTTQVLSLSGVAAGTGYAPGNTIVLGGGTPTIAPTVTVSTTKVSAVPGIVNGGTGGTPGTATVTGTTGTGTKFQANVTISAGGIITAVNSMTVAGSYTVNPTTLTNEPVTGGGLTGAALSIVMGVNTFTDVATGTFSANPAANTFTQNSTSGSGTGATFLGLFGCASMSFISPGTYTVFPSNPVAQAATSGSGAGVTFTVANSSSISSIDSIALDGAYSVNPTSLVAEPVTGGGLTGATVALQMGIGSVTVSTPGIFTSNAAGNIFTQASTSGAGVGATFAFGLFGPSTLTVTNGGIYSSFPANPIAQASTTGAGLGATYNVTSGTVAPIANGAWVNIQGVGGMTQLNGRTFVVGNATPTQFSLFDVFGNPIDATAYGAYTAGGTAANIFELVTPYGVADLPYLKFTQSADVMSLCCVNQNALAEYPPMDLTRLADNNWTIAPTQFGAVTPALASLTHGPGGGNTEGQQFVIWYYVTAVDNVTGEESVPTQAYVINGALGALSTSNNVFVNRLFWPAVRGNVSYYIYAETAVPQLGTNGNDLLPPPTFMAGLIGKTMSTSFSDTDIAPDFSKGPPQHNNPFARSAIIAAPVVTGGAGYQISQHNAKIPFATVTSATGSGAIVSPIYVGGTGYIGNIYVQNGGAGYKASDTIAIGGGGSGATATLTVGPATGTYPSVVSYFQERRVFGSTINNPDTYWMSKPGLFLNFDTSFPTVGTDAITGSPWAVEVNGIQWMVNMPGGLVVLTGQSAWQLTGAGGSSLNPVPITPAAQQAQPQAFNGVSPTVPPIKIDYQIVYVQAKGAIVREFSYQFFQNIYTGVDLTEFSSHLFTGFTLLEWCYAEEPSKIIWAVRNDGSLLSLTYLKGEQVQGWSRHDTNGQYHSVCSVVEPPVDAVYVATQRYIGGNFAYMIERMDNRNWPTAEQSWCVDAGVTTPLFSPQATITAASPTGLGAITGVTSLIGGSGYSANTQAVITDNNAFPTGSGATPVLTIVGGVITAVTFPAGGVNYTFPRISFVDPAGSAGGSGASASCVINDQVAIGATAPVFSGGSVGGIIRAYGGIARITSYINPTAVMAQILLPFTQIRPNSGSATTWPQVYPALPGYWSLAFPATVIGGLYHLIGATVTGVADGNVIPPQLVAPDGTITLSTPATLVTVGLGFTAQLQTVAFDAGQGAATQGRRKRIAAATCRLSLSRDVQVGTNQPDGASLSPQQLAPGWSELTPLPNMRTPTINALCTPLFTGDMRVPTPGNMDTRGQLALQQSNPLPMNVSAVIPEILEGDVEAGKNGSQPAGGGNGVQDTGYYFTLIPVGSIAFVGPPSTGISGVPLAFIGVVTPSGAAVEIAFGPSLTTPPTSGWTDAVVSGGNWSVTLTPYI